MDVKQKQRTVIEFLLLEGCKGDDIVPRLQNAHGGDAYCRPSVPRWVNEIRRDHEELRDEGRPGRSCRYETNAALPSSLRVDPNPSLRTIADKLSNSPEPVRIHMSRIGHTLKSLRGFPTR
jgi:hypothetical protein